ncbi:MAG TPA: UDP-N-acetylmuramoyl-tripeptide--D-alanyl-D-alanine ligase [Solirubrobacteraceae bacterium]|jgi:UDP-N-acetylmuramoyl-tripeptide--D-alanyl-D-alanine ligase|nr:UDP-N-acetylmuramoyl-tripeptide--D-alanyl-D-alanine ligase [Solirubrobacteraceae bacterium]
MSAWDARRLAAASGAELLRDGGGEAREEPPSAAVDTRALRPGELFVGLAGEREDGGARAAEALAGGAWGVLVSPQHAPGAVAAAERLGATADEPAGTVLVHPRPLQALQRLASAWREELASAGARVVAVTGSTGKTSTKDILAALLAGAMPTAASPANLNTEIGLPLAVLDAPAGTRALVLEMAMRGRGQIAELTEIAAPDVGVIVNVGPAHLELLGSLEAIAAAKAELIAGLRPGSKAVVPAGELLLQAHMRPELETVTFGAGGDVRLLEGGPDGRVRIDAGGELVELEPSFRQAHNLCNLLAAVAAARALGVHPSGRLQVTFSAMRGQRAELPSGVLLIDDCYNANPMSVRAAIDDLAAEAGEGREGRHLRSVAVLGDMLELGPSGPALHREIGEHARRQGVGLLVTVGPLAAAVAQGFGGESHTLADAARAAEVVPQLVGAGDVVLVKGSRGVGLERVAEALREAVPAGQR